MRIQLDHIAFGVPVVAAAAAFVAGRLGGVADQGGPAPGYNDAHPGWQEAFLHLKVASDRLLDLPDGPVSSLGARFVLSQGGLSAPMSG